MKKYNQLTEYEREVIRVELEQGKKYRAIGRILGRSHTTVSREVERNTMEQGPDKGKYIACKAHTKAQKRASNQRRKAPLKCPFIFLYVRQKLRKYWSPESIAGRLSKEHPEYSIHHETIYRYIYSKPVRNRYKLWRYLTLKRPKRREQTGRSVRRLKGKIPNAVSIDLRPKLVDARVEFGHFETDLMEGPRTSKAALSNTIERKTRYSLLFKVVDQTANQKTESLNESLSIFPNELINSITVDNGKENSQHKKWVKQFETSVYFCHAYHSWEKGSVENQIGRVRRFIPKGTPLTTVTQKQIAQIQYWLNHTPRKCLKWQTPHEALQEELSNRSLTI